jgi:hypothetical protein
VTVEIPLSDACPDLRLELDDGDHVAVAMAFVLVEHAEDHDHQQVQVVTSAQVSQVLLRGLLEVGRDAMLAGMRGET